jgi:type VI secretion system protein ImpH
MSSPQRRPDPGVISRLTAQPHQFEFFQALRLLQRWLGNPPRGDLVPSRLRLRNSVSLAFPAGEIESLRVFPDAAASLAPAPANGAALPQCVELVPTMMGLLGLNGALPAAYTDLVAQRELYQRDLAARAFLDLFSHRMLALFYAGWKKHRLHLQYEADRRQRYAPIVLALGGLGQDALQARLAPEAGGVDDESLAYFAGTLQQRVLSAGQLTQVLRAYLKVPVRVEQFVGRWYELPAQAQTALGQRNGILGRNALMGGRVWQRDLRVGLALGPLDPARFRRFLPGGAGALALRKLLGLLSGTRLEFEVRLGLQASAVQGMTLDSQRPTTACRLGWDTYLVTRPAAHDRCDVRYDLDHAISAP